MKYQLLYNAKKTDKAVKKIPKAAIDQKIFHKIEELLMDVHDAKELNKAKITRQKLASGDRLKKLLSG